MLRLLHPTDTYSRDGNQRTNNRTLVFFFQSNSNPKNEGQILLPGIRLARLPRVQQRAATAFVVLSGPRPLPRVRRRPARWWWNWILASTRTSYVHFSTRCLLRSRVQLFCFPWLGRRPHYIGIRFVLLGVWIYCPLCSSGVYEGEWVTWLCFGATGYLGFFSVWTCGCARVRVSKLDWEFFSSWLLVGKYRYCDCVVLYWREVWSFVIEVGWELGIHQQSLKGQFCLMAWGRQAQLVFSG
jgi:hypothetical protein